MRLVAALIAVFSSACAVDPEPSSVQCTSRFDCANGEKCSDGVCAVAGRVIIREPADAGAGQASLKDAGRTDSGTTNAPDSGGALQPPDSGAIAPPDPACNAGISVVELPGQSFCTIGEAILAAPSSGTVDVPSATYAESLTIDKPLTVRGVAPVTIRALPSRPVLTINATDVMILSTVLEANANEGVDILGTALLQDVTIKNSVGAGVRVVGEGSILNTRNVLVSRVSCAGACTALDWGEGIVFESGTAGLLIDTIIEDTDFVGLYAQNAVVHMDNGWIKRAGRTYCPQDDLRCTPGVYLFDNTSAVFGTNTWIQESGGSGIEMMESLLEMSSSRVENNGLRLVPFVDGIHAVDSSATLVDNIINGNLGFGIGCEGTVLIASCLDNTHENNQEGWTNGVCGGC